MRRVVESRLRKAGLHGTYATADCKLGREVYKAALGGRGTYLWGQTGRGKTYAACCAVRLAVLDGRMARKVSASSLLEEIKQGWSGGDRRALVRAQTAWLLVLDDLGAEHRSDWSMGTLEGLVDHRTERGLPTVVTSNYSLGQIRDMWGGVEGARMASRIAGACDRREVTGTDRRLA